MMRRLVLASSALLAVSLAFACVVRADDVAPPPAESKGAAFEPGTPAFADVLSKAKSAGKLVFIDFSTDWCGWCKKLDKDTFSQASVGDVMKSFVNVHIDAEKGEGPDLAKRFGVHGFPTLVVVDAGGDEVDRIVGYMPPEPFTKELGRIQKGEGTLASLRKKYADSPDDVDAGIALAAKLVVAQPEAASKLFADLTEKAKTKDRPTQANLHLEYAVSLLETDRAEDAMKEAETLVSEFADTPAAAQAVARVGMAFTAADVGRALAFLDKARVIAKDGKDRMAVEAVAYNVHRNAMAAALVRQAEAAGDDPQALNEVAWNCFEMKVNVRKAIGWAKRAADKSDRDPAILDTLANLMWLAGQRDDAMKIEEEAAEKADGNFKREFAAVVARWRAEQEAMKAAGAIPATPIGPAPGKPAGTDAK